jgi:hypothetical protein
MLKLSIAAVWFSLLAVGVASASSTRSIDADSITSSDKTKTFTLPSSSQTLTGASDPSVFTNKSISGATNTLTLLPIGANIVQEIPSGTVNGTNTTFILSNTPPANSAVVLTMNGLTLVQGSGNDYTISGATITMLSAPATGQKLYAVYSKY